MAPRVPPEPPCTRAVALRAPPRASPRGDPEGPLANVGSHGPSRSSQLTDGSCGLDSGRGQIFSHHLRVMREGDLGILDLGVPLLLPFEAVVTRVPGRGQHLDLLL